MKFVTAEEAVAVIKSEDRVFAHTDCHVSYEGQAHERFRSSS